MGWRIKGGEGLVEPSNFEGNSRIINLGRAVRCKMPLREPRTPTLRQPFETVESDEPRGIAPEVLAPPSHALALSHAELKVEGPRGVNVAKSRGVQVLPCSKDSRARGTWLVDQPLAQLYIPEH